MTMNSGYNLLPVGDLMDASGMNINPDPIIPEEADVMNNDFLSPGKLQEISGREDIENVTFMELQVDTSETTLGNFGNYLPSLKQLKLSNSIIPSVRDIGTSLAHINVLWMACCGLKDVDGIASMVSLTELYLAYNDISDMSPISFLDNLEVLDLEGNQVADQEQFEYLGLLSKLRTLTLSANPVCQLLNNESLASLDESSFGTEIKSDALLSYRETIIRKLPNLIFLDDQKANDLVCKHSSSSEQQVSLTTSSHSQEDLEFITNAIKEGLISENDTNMDTSDASNTYPAKLNSSTNMRPKTAGLWRPMSARIGMKVGAQSSKRPLTAFSRTTTSDAVGHMEPKANNQRPSSSGSGEVCLQDESSVLTFGNVICGNPIRALRSRKSSPIPVLSLLQSDDAASCSNRSAAIRPATAAVHTQFHSAQTEKSSNTNANMNDVFADLREWRANHEKRVKERDVQILKIEHDSLSEELYGSDTDSGSDEVLDLDSIPGLQDDNNNFDIPKLTEKDPVQLLNVKDRAEKSIIDNHQDLRSYRRSQVYSPPPKNLSPSSMTSSLSPRHSPVTPRSPIFSSSQLDGATVPVLRGSPKIASSPSNLQNKVGVKHLPAPPKVGNPRPRTAGDSRNKHLRRSVASLARDSFVPLASPMNIQQALAANKTKTGRQEVKP